MESNEYLKQVVQEQARVEGELRNRRSVPVPPAAAQAATMAFGGVREQPAGQAIEYRVTGWWWKTVVVPPNVYVVHTRSGHKEPLHLGLGISFRYNPYTDAFLVIPAAVQTLLINAKCICAERQGVLVQAYVQWVVDDLRTAYRKLDFSDPSDPMRIVNVQLREQAEAAIKDKVATMAIDAILSDKQPIIEELTHRLRGVAESSGEGAGGLGLKIVTIQIKEAVVSSTRLWENLQKPFRADREKLARLAELQSSQEIAARELTIRQAKETAEIETACRLAELRAEQRREEYDREQSETARRYQLEREAEQARILADEQLATKQHELEAKRVARELEATDRLLALERARAELEKARAAAIIERENLDHWARAGREERDVEVLSKRRAVENELSEANVRSQLIARLPEVAKSMPKPNELRAVTVNGDGASALTGLLAQLLSVVEGALPHAATNGNSVK